jgi:hypothetical protein
MQGDVLQGELGALLQNELEQGDEKGEVRHRGMVLTSGLEAQERDRYRARKPAKMGPGAVCGIFGRHSGEACSLSVLPGQAIAYFADAIRIRAEEEMDLGSTCLGPERSLSRLPPGL